MRMFYICALFNNRHLSNLDKQLYPKYQNKVLIEDSFLDEIFLSNTNQKMDKISKRSTRTRATSASRGRSITRV